MRTTLIHAVALALVAGFAAGHAQTAKTLDLYLIDVEGGNAQLYRLPGGESVLIDSGNGGAGAARDADRIMAAAKDAGVTQIDHLITTHFHGDHVGGLPELAGRITIRDFIDHGPNVQPGPPIDPVMARYAQLYAAASHRVAKPGDKLAVKDVDWHIVSAGGQVIKRRSPVRDSQTGCAATSGDTRSIRYQARRSATRKTSSRSAVTSRSGSSACSISATSPGTRNSISRVLPTGSAPSTCSSPRGTANRARTRKRSSTPCSRA